MICFEAKRVIPKAIEQWIEEQESEYKKRWSNKFPSDLAHDLWLMRSCYKEMYEHLKPLVEALKESCWCGTKRPGEKCDGCLALEELGLD